MVNVTQHNDLIERAMEMAVIYHRAGSLREAEALYSRVLSLDPGHSGALQLLGAIALQIGRNDVAVDLIQKSLAGNPNNFEAYSNLGMAYKNLGRLIEAVESYNKALAINPNSAPIHCNLGNAFFSLGKLNAAAACYRDALRLDPNDAQSHMNLALVINDTGEFDETIDLYRRAIELNPDYSEAYSNLLLNLHYKPGITKQQLYEEALKFGKRFDTGATASINNPNPDRPLRIGFVSADFKSHPVGFYIEGLFKHHDKGNFQFLCYANQSNSDTLTERLKSNSLAWHSIYGLPDEEVAAMIKQDKIDMLIDLSGHSGMNRLPLFALKPAPVQMTWIGYFDTTGLKAMDYVIADETVLPQSEEKYYTEKPLRLSGCYLAMLPPQFDIKVAPLPAKKNGYITFGCFNNLKKMTPEVIQTWAEILKQIPTAKLLLKTRSFDEEKVKQSYLKKFRDEGIDEQRISLSGHEPIEAMFEAYSQVDIALDPFPFNGNTTTVHAAWMGVPTITLDSDSFTGHMGKTVLNASGMENMVTTSSSAYIAKAVSMATDINQLADLRMNLREKLVNSAMCNTQAFARKFEDALRTAWRKACEKTA